MCKPSAPATIAPQSQPEPEPIQEQTQADATSTKASAAEREASSSLGGRNIRTGARGLGDEAKTKKKSLLGD